VLLAWAPTPAFRQPILALILIALLALGVEALRRQTSREFPNATRELSFRRLRDWASGGGKRARETPTGPAEAAGSLEPADPRLDKLERLARMRDSGVLDASEYTAEKARVLADEPRPA
jgi:hypothetical protein